MGGFVTNGHSVALLKHFACKNLDRSILSLLSPSLNWNCIPSTISWFAGRENNNRKIKDLPYEHKRCNVCVKYADCMMQRIYS